MYHGPTELRQVDTGIRDAARFALGIGATGAIFLIGAMVWVSTCQGATADSLACGAAQRTLLALAAPAVLFAGGLRAFFRAYQLWRGGEMSSAWQGAGWFLLTSMLLVLTTSMPALAGFPVLGA
ncbi:hypothetical protein AU190_06160 [Mycolicibacterium acapulense]|uniref:Transmembrane protein n=1 Tax=Mycobacterium lehmannii TaxID=2048550 RepID=A0A101AAX5_9MYCO|nr:hypothetical protein [Mycobacterium lehmannii]KUH93140.1 hypothetical protein AU189_23085 [Mycolicibacterium acapulense]KUH96596.1 hypothetical protein AU190_06160 [Mycolicibacterium acapulense]KUI17578.1 hypothetical protein AU191_09815 [Mycolicibacterium acapulense]KUI19493.1 hypothetical protein AU192_06660 [Mycobacterium lehmannii]